jgi:hypothetical protein
VPTWPGLLEEESSTFHFNVYGSGEYHEIGGLYHLIFDHWIKPSTKLINPSHDKETQKKKKSLDPDTQAS